MFRGNLLGFFEHSPQLKSLKPMGPRAPYMVFGTTALSVLIVRFFVVIQQLQRLDIGNSS